MEEGEEEVDYTVIFAEADSILSEEATEVAAAVATAWAGSTGSATMAPKTKEKTMAKEKTLADEIFAQINQEATVEEVEVVEDTSWPELLAPVEDRKHKLFSSLFGWVPEEGDFLCSVFNEPDSPNRNMNYLWPKRETEMFSRAIENGWKPRLVGPPGTGKTELANQYAAITGRCFLRINFNIGIEPEDILGGMELVAGEKGHETVYKMGDLPKFVSRPSIILMDELSRATAMMTMILQRFLEKGELYLPQKREGENIIFPHPELGVCAADNSLGLGDGMDKYGSTQVQDVSSLNRWQVCIALGYQARSEEETLIKSFSSGKLPDIEVRNLAKFSELCHMGFLKSELAMPFSPRNLEVISVWAIQLRSVKTAITYNYLNTLDEDSANACRTMIKTIWG